MWGRLFGLSAEGDDGEWRGTRPVMLRQLVDRREERARAQEASRATPEAGTSPNTPLVPEKEEEDEEPVVVESTEFVTLTSTLTDEERAVFSINDHLKLHNILGKAVLVMSLFVGAVSAYLYETM